MKQTTLTHQENREVRQVLDIGQVQGWDVAVLGQAPMPQIPLTLGRWLVVPAQQDNSPLPERTMGRIQTLFEQGARPKGFVIVHETALLLSAPATAEPLTNISFRSPLHRKMGETVRRLPLFLGAGLLAVAGATLLAALLVTVLVIVAVVGLVVGVAAGIDPILIAVMDDDTWIEIDRWWIESE